MTLELITSPPPAPRSFEDDERPPDGTGRLITALIVGVPFLALAVAVFRFWGHGVGLRDVAPRRDVVLPHRPRDDDRLPPAAGAQVVHRQPTAQDRAHRRRLDGVRGRADQLGGQPPATPHLRRHRRRSPLAAAPRWELDGADEGPLARPRRLAVHRSKHLAAAARRRPAGRSRHRRDRRAVPVLVRRLAGVAVRSRVAARRHVGGGAERPAVGGPGSDLRAASRDVERQLGVPHVRPTTVRDQGPQQQRRRCSPCSAWASRGTTATMPSRARSATGCCAGSGIPRRC